MKRSDLFVIMVCVCLVGVLGYGLGDLLSSRTSSDNKKSDLDLSTTGHSWGLQSLTTAMADVGLSNAESGVSFLVNEAGICAYGNVGGEINLTEAKAAFRGVEYESADYIIGSVPIPDYLESEDVHVYIHRTGWIVAYYTKTEFVAKIIKDFMAPADNKIEDAITVICTTIWIQKPEISYYDFRHPEANTLMIVGDQVVGYAETNTFRIFVPSEIVNNISRFEWYYYGDNTFNTFRMRGQLIYGGYNIDGTYGTITLVPPDMPDELLEATELKLSTLTEASVYSRYSDTKTQGGFIILLHYD